MDKRYGNIDGRCCFAGSVDCQENSCLSCGWNPEVAKKRIRAWCEKRLSANKDGSK